MPHSSTGRHRISGSSEFKAQDPTWVGETIDLLCTGIKSYRSASGSQLVEDDLWNFPLWLSIPTEPLG